MDHVHDATDEVSIAIGEITVIALDQCIEAEVAILAEWNFAQQKIAQSVCAQHFAHGIGAYDVAARLRHLALIEEQPPLAFTERGTGIPAAIRNAGQ